MDGKAEGNDHEAHGRSNFGEPEESEEPEGKCSFEIGVVVKGSVPDTPTMKSCVSDDDNETDP